MPEPSQNLTPARVFGCSGNCHQGRTCDCAEPDPKAAAIFWRLYIAALVVSGLLGAFVMVVMGRAA